MKKRNAIAFVLAAALALPMALAGCGGSPAPAASAPDTAASASDTAPAEKAESKTEPKGEPVELSYYFSCPPINEMDRIMEKVNAQLEEKINVRLNLVPVGDAYADKMNLMISSGDPFDICFSAFWANNFWENANKGAFADLTELIPEYAPQSYSRIPEGLWDGVKIEGRIYAIPNYQQWGVAQRKGVGVRRDIAEEVGFDYAKMKKKPMLEVMSLLDSEYLSKAVPAHPDMIGWEVSSGYDSFLNEPLIWDYENVGDLTSPGWIKFTEPDKVINQFATPEYAEYLNIMRGWYQKGYVRKDGATVKDTSPDRKAKKMLAAYFYAWPDTVDMLEKGIGNPELEGMSMTQVIDGKAEAPAVYTSITRTVIPATAASNACTTISAGSPNKEKALELIELLNTDDDLFMLLTSGEEGVDYIYDEDGNYSLVEGKYNISYNEWQLGQSYSPDFTRALGKRGELGEKDHEKMSVVFEGDRNADTSPVTGFNFDPTPVKTQMAQCSSIITEMVPALGSGSVDPAAKLPEFLSRLEQAGVNDIISEKQTQYDAWRAANGK